MYQQETSKQYEAYKAYYQAVSKTKQVVMLYDGAIKYMQKAIEAIEEENIQDRYNALEKASSIVVGLQAALDFEKGKDISEALENYYFSIDMRIISVHRSQDIEMCNQIIKELRQMRDAWEEVDQTIGKDSADQVESESSSADIVG